MELNNYNVSKIILIGGEPLMFDGINKLVVFVRKIFPNAKIVLYSNLTLLDDDNIGVLRDNNIKVNTSIYSDSCEIHDDITRRKGSFDKTIKAIKKLKQHNIYVKANIAIMNDNYKISENIIKFVYDLTGVKPKCYLIRDVGVSKKSLVIQSDSQAIRPNFKLISRRDFVKNISGNSCWQGKINITCDGFISPCIMGNKYIDYSYNVKQNSLRQIMGEYVKKEFWNLSMDCIEICKDCEYRYACSDCRPICEGKNKKTGKCKYNPYKGLWE